MSKAGHAPLPPAPKVGRGNRPGSPEFGPFPAVNMALGDAGGAWRNGAGKVGGAQRERTRPDLCAGEGRKQGYGRHPPVWRRGVEAPGQKVSLAWVPMAALSRPRPKKKRRQQLLAARWELLSREPGKRGGGSLSGLPPPASIFRFGIRGSPVRTKGSSWRKEEDSGSVLVTVTGDCWWAGPGIPGFRRQSWSSSRRCRHAR